MDNNIPKIEQMPPNRQLRCVAVGCHNWTSAGSYEGGRRAAAIYSLVSFPSGARLTVS